MVISGRLQLRTNSFGFVHFVFKELYSTADVGILSGTRGFSSSCEVLCMACKFLLNWTELQGPNPPEQNNHGGMLRAPKGEQGYGIAYAVFRVLP